MAKLITDVWHTDVLALLDRRPEVRGVSSLADMLADSVTWGA